MNDYQDHQDVAGATKAPQAPGDVVSPKSGRIVLWYMITAASLVSWVSIVDTGVEKSQDDSYIAYSISAGAVSMAVGLLFIAFYSIGFLRDWAFGSSPATLKEFWTLMFLSIWWIVAVALMTRDGGISFDALNIYYSVWLSLIITLWALNSWFYARGTLSARDFTNLSPTLSGWYCMAFSSLVMMGSSANVYDYRDILSTGTESQKTDYVFAIVVGTISLFLSLIMVVAHYHVFPCILPSSLGEIMIALSLLGLWVAAVIVLTRANGIASQAGNIYYSTWAAFFNTIYILAKWKRADREDEVRKSASENNIDDDMDDI